MDNGILTKSGGWDRSSGEISPGIATEIKQAFDNVDHNIKNARGRGWSEVYKVTSYHVKPNPEALGLFVDNMMAFCPDHSPCWTAIGADRLGRDDMRIEIDVAAHSPKQSEL